MLDTSYVYMDIYLPTADAGRVRLGSRPGSCNTTDIHLPRRIGEAVKRAFHGTLDEHFDEGGYFVRVNWVSDI
jgi:hypothetical protein